MSVKKIKLIITLCSIAVFLLSLTQKCFCTNVNCQDSITALLLGWIGNLSWYANPILMYTWFSFNLSSNEKSTIILSGLAMTLSASFILYHPFSFMNYENSLHLVSLKLGYWLWLLSFFIIFYGAWYINKKKKQAKFEN